MKKISLILVLSILAVVLSACSPKVAIPCGEGSIGVRLNKAQEAYETCSLLNGDEEVKTKDKVDDNDSDNSEILSQPESTNDGSVVNEEKPESINVDTGVAWEAVETSANSNGNFIADLGGHGKGAIIPNNAIDLQGKTWPIGRVLLTYCEDASTCFFSYGEPGEELSRAFNVNAYTPEFDGELADELQYVDTGWNNNADVTWTYMNN